MVQRATGRTYRHALQALIDASHGKRVLWVVGNWSEHSTVMAELKKLTGPRGLVSTSMVTFPNEGLVQVGYLHSSYTGKRYDRVVMDELLGCTWRDIEPFMETRQRITKQ